MARARLVLKTKTAHQDGVVEMVVWQVPSPVPPSEHAFKYRFVFVRDGERINVYDNERGKGDYKHVDEREVPYKFVDIETLMADFLRDVEAKR